MAILLAAMHPSRVSSLVLYGSYARRTWAPDYPYPQTAEERAAYTEHLVTGWDWEADMRMRTPSADVAMQRWWARRMRAAATPGTIRALMNMNDSVDVRQVLPSVRVPTLVLHRVEDALFSVDEARYLAERIPGARAAHPRGRRPLRRRRSRTAHRRHRALRRLSSPRARNAQRSPRSPYPSGAAAEEVAELLVTSGGRRRVTEGGATVVLFDGPATAVRAAYAAVAGRPARSASRSPRCRWRGWPRAASAWTWP